MIEHLVNRFNELDAKALFFELCKYLVKAPFDNALKPFLRKAGEGGQIYMITHYCGLTSVDRELKKEFDSHLERSGQFLGLSLYNLVIKFEDKHNYFKKLIHEIYKIQVKALLLYYSGIFLVRELEDNLKKLLDELDEILVTSPFDIALYMLLQKACGEGQIIMITGYCGLPSADRELKKDLEIIMDKSPMLLLHQSNIFLRKLQNRTQSLESNNCNFGKSKLPFFKGGETKAPVNIINEDDQPIISDEDMAKSIFGQQSNTARALHLI